jgi:hypothetical protein
MTQPRAPSPCRARAEWLETRGGLDHPNYDSATKMENASVFAATWFPSVILPATLARQTVATPFARSNIAPGKIHRPETLR